MNFYVIFKKNKKMNIFIISKFIVSVTLVFGALPPTTTVATSTTDNNLLTRWVKTTGAGYGGLANNVLNAYYDSSKVYITTNSIPSYSIGPWTVPTANYPTTAKNYKLTLSRTAKSATTKKSNKLGVIGVLLDGSVM